MGQDQTDLQKARLLLAKQDGISHLRKVRGSIDLES
jgi:hypothetical protein